MGKIIDRLGKFYSKNISLLLGCDKLLLLMKYLFFLSLLFIQFTAFSQEVETTEEPRKQRYGIGLLPSSAENIYGLAIGIIGSEAICNRYYTKKSHGINIQLLSQGFFSVFHVFKDDFNFSKTNIDSISYGDSTAIKRVIHNGFLLSTFGTFSEDINGISISPWMSINHKVNGVSMNVLVNSIHSLNGVTIGLYNATHKTKGLQIGLVNQTNKLKGFQVGLWNVNNKRKLPIVNWAY